MAVLCGSFKEPRYVCEVGELMTFWVSETHLNGLDKRLLWVPAYGPKARILVPNAERDYVDELITVRYLGTDTRKTNGTPEWEVVEDGQTEEV